MSSITLPPRLFGTVGYYRAMCSGPEAVIDTSARYDKRCKSVHRYEIADVRGRVQLTVPLSKPQGVDATWADCLVSTHDCWWTRHLLTLESAYGRTPYFEFLIDKFNEIFRSPADWQQWPTAIDLARRCDEIVRGCLQFPTHVKWAIPEGDSPQEYHYNDPFTGETDCYYQVRNQKLGFIADLSILDLLFNLGPEGAIFLRR